MSFSRTTMLRDSLYRILLLSASTTENSKITSAFVASAFSKCRHRSVPSTIVVTFLITSVSVLTQLPSEPSPHDTEDVARTTSAAVFTFARETRSGAWALPETQLRIESNKTTDARFINSPILIRESYAELQRLVHQHCKLGSLKE